MKDKTPIAQSVMAKIENESITPKPRWAFLLREYGIWLSGIVSIVTGGIAMSVVAFAMVNTDWFLYEKIGGSIFSYILTVMPFLWIVFLLLFIGFAIFQIKHTRHGYMYSFGALISGNIFFSMVLGVLLFTFGYGHMIDTYTDWLIPAYHASESKREHLWVQPSKGVLAGIVVGTTTDDAYELQDFTGTLWKVTTRRLDLMDRHVLSFADEVGIVGNRSGTSTFEACAVRPWSIKGAHMRLREEMVQEMMRGGLSPKELEIHRAHHRQMMGGGIMESKVGERNLSELRNKKCEGGASSPR